MSVETIFDHNITEAEIAVILPSVITKEQHLSFGGNEDSEFGLIHNLYSFRGDDVTAKAYLAKIKDLRYRFNVGSCDTDH
jgi:hypothetical protein